MALSSEHFKSNSYFSFDARFEFLEWMEWMYKKSDSVNNGLLNHSRIRRLPNLYGKTRLCLNWWAFSFWKLCNRSSFCTSQHQSMVFIVHLYASMIPLLTCRFQAKVNGRNGASGRLVPQLAWKVFQWEGGNVVLSHAKGTLLRLKPARRQTA